MLSPLLVSQILTLEMGTFQGGRSVGQRHVGNISCSEYNHRYRWVDISNLIGAEEYQRSNLCKLALAAAIGHLFTVSKFHRITAGTYSNHLAGITLLTNIGFTKEGVQREALVHSGHYVDGLKFSLLDREWPRRAKKYPAIQVAAPPWERVK